MHEIIFGYLVIEFWEKLYKLFLNVENYFFLCIQFLIIREHLIAYYFYYIAGFRESLQSHCKKMKYKGLFSTNYREWGPMGTVRVK